MSFSIKNSLNALHPPKVECAVMVALVYAALAEVLIYYFGKSDCYFNVFFPEELIRYRAEPESRIDIIFASKLWWVGCGVVIYFVIPTLWIWLRGGKLKDYGIRRPTSYGHLWVYVAMMVIVAAMAYFASFKPSFLKTYPYFKPYMEAPALYALFWVGRAVRFFALEFFYRGYLLFALKEKMGDAAIFVSMIPYCMLHMGKPFPEVLFAIVGGIIFGWIALRTKSIWGAVVLHVFLAVSMDFFAIAQQQGWFK